MPLDLLARSIRAHLSDDFGPSSRTDIRTYAISELKRRGVKCDYFATLPQIAALIETLIGQRPSIVRAA